MNWSLGDYANTREIAMGVWLAVFIAFVFGWSKTREAAMSAVKSLGNWKVLTSLATYAVFLSGVVWCSWKLDVWTPKLLGATVIWFIASGLVLYVNAITKASKTDGYFRRHLRDTIRLAAFFEFMVNVQTLAWWAELILFPVLTCLVMLQAAAETTDEYRAVGRMFASLLGIVSLALIGTTIVSFVQAPGTFVLGDVVRELFLPIWLAAAAAPFAYAAAVIAGFESMMVRLARFSDRRAIPLRVRLGLISALGTDLRAIDRFAGQRGRQAVATRTFRSARHEVEIYFAEVEADRARRESARQRLVNFSGATGVDEDGMWLDRREFRATKSALEWLYVCHSGHYRNNNRFDPNVLTLIGNFDRQGLPNPHGIVMKVGHGGQSWFAYRQTVSGYYFGIGAVGGPNEQWYYDGDHAAGGFPSEKGGWSSYLASVRSEWREEAPV
ncbi:hypothetical protein ABH924_003625 [Arthrobacter sp. GAS37]|uniref:hypothetical protein n=1 Tax=Arthrobacter sp. GAS37 TaxID=3156261 RepID=UPI00383439B4